MAHHALLRWLVVAGLVAGCSLQEAHNAPGAIAAGYPVPLTTVEFSGHRYVARADLGLGQTVPLMIHGNSRMFLSLTHDVGAKLNGGPVAKTEPYGYSSRGKGTLHLARLRIGGKSFSKIPPVPVFDFTEAGDTVVQGMLGVPFLVAARAAVDFGRDELLLCVPRTSRPDRALLARGYRSCAIAVTAGNRVTLDARFPALDRVLPITPSTVSTALTLHLPLFKDKVAMSRALAPDRSPNGTTPDEFVSERVDFEVAGVRMQSPATFEDFAEYGKVSERDLESYGMLGFDWMKQHQAILDYANRVLYFMP